MRKIVLHCLFILILPANTAISQEIFGSKIASPGNRRKRNTLAQHDQQTRETLDNSPWRQLSPATSVPCRKLLPVTLAVFKLMI